MVWCECKVKEKTIFNDFTWVVGDDELYQWLIEDGCWVIDHRTGFNFFNIFTLQNPPSFVSPNLPYDYSAITLHHLNFHTFTTVWYVFYLAGIEVDKSQGNSPVDLRPSSISIGSTAAIILTVLIVAVIVVDSEGCYRAVRFRGI